MDKEFRDIIETSFPEFDIDSAYEYKNLVVFNLRPKDLELEEDQVLLNSSFSIDKKTKALKVFKPFDISVEDYQNGRKIM